MSIFVIKECNYGTRSFTYRASTRSWREYEEFGYRFFLNLGFAVIEIVGGIWTNSVAIISDAVHDFGDAFSIGVSYFLERYSRKKRTVTFTYGYKRFSTLGALINSIVLLVGSIFVFMETIPRLFHPAEVNYSGMMWWRWRDLS